MSIHIVTDSTSDLPDDLIKDLPISTIPLYINLNNRSYLDRLELSRKDFYQALPTADLHPTTAAPAPGQYIELYNSLADKGATAIFSIHIANSLSAVYQSAKAAANLFSRIPVHVVNSGNLSLAEGLIVLKAAYAAKEGMNEEELDNLINKLISRAYAYAKLDTIDYLLRGGRITSIQHSVIGLLGIKPILRMHEDVSKMEIARTKSRAFERVLHVALDVIPHAEIFGISHANAADQVEKLINEIQKVFPDFKDPIIGEVTPALGTHVGPGAVCINWIDKDAPVEEELRGFKKWFH